MICPDVDDAELSRISERIRAGIESTAITSPSGTVRVTASAGACLLKAEEDPLGIYRRADRLLMKAKKAGRNVVCFAQSVTTLK